MDGNRLLWAAVLERAVLDLDINPEITNNDLIINRTKNWFISKNENLGSFIWICNTLDIDHKKVLSYDAIKKRLK
jgi:hypothetical protein